MRSLFIKLLLSFWFVMILTAVAFTLIYETTRPTEWIDRQRQITSLALRQFGEMAVDRVRQDGPQAYAPLAEELQRSTRFIATLVVQGQFLGLETEISKEVEDLAREVLETGVAAVRTTGNSTITAEPLSFGTGEPAVIVGEQRFPPTWWRWIRPETLELRLLVVVLISGLASLLLARYLSMPIRKLRKATHRLAAGDLGVRVGPSLGRRKDETADLGRDFDYMAARIEELLGAQRRLVRDISHELRSPLARLNVALELSRRQAGDLAPTSLDRIERESERLNELIGQLLTIAQLEHQETRIAMEQVDLDALVDEVVKDSDFEAQGRGRRVLYPIRERVEVVGNKDLLRRSVENVVRNGIRFTPEGTAVEVELTAESADGGPVARIVVRDQGPGVEPEAMGEIFRPFYRLEEARDRVSGGTGLGLAITESSIRVHGGTVNARNRPEGGLEVTLEIPRMA
ncbi:MAG: HAMP domain-containing protein [Bradymonadales bacterium]|nr:HAMP domain-containing protein [Bradymonadales bacterium]